MADPFEDILNLEEQFYQDGYKQGLADGLTAGRTEGRQLGLEKGYQKFLESGKLHGRAIVWGNRLPRARQQAAAAASEKETKSQPSAQLPSLSANPRLEKHITTLYALAETESLSVENTDEAVNDFDDRLKRAQGKFKIVERMVGEAAPGAAKGNKAAMLESSGGGGASGAGAAPKGVGTEI